MSKVGRPTDYREEFCEQATELMSKGYSKEAVAGSLGICKDTLYRWAKEHKQFSDAIKRGEVASQLFWEGLGLTGIILGKADTFAQGAWAFNMKARFGWRDTPKEDDIKKKPIKLKYSVEVDEE
jgi:hypothetical protein